MSEILTKLKKCLDCESDIAGSHFNRKRCTDCAKKVALSSNRKSIKTWKQNNPDKVKALNKSWNERFPLRKRFTHAKDIARSRGYECAISNERFLELWNQPCTYCGNSILEETGIGLDRIDNLLGYTESNILPCCGSCNIIRGYSLTVEEMKVAMAAVIQYRKDKGANNE